MTSTYLINYKTTKLARPSTLRRARTGFSNLTTPSTLHSPVVSLFSFDRSKWRCRLYCTLLLQKLRRTRSVTPVSSKIEELSHSFHILNNYFSRFRPAAFLSEIATNLSARNIPVVIYSGNDDSVVAHLSSEGNVDSRRVFEFCALIDMNAVTIQNTTFGGIQGFTKKPQTPWYDDQGRFAGIVHQERDWTYVLVDHAGHQVPLYAPESVSEMRSRSEIHS